MQMNVRIRATLTVLVILACIYGLFGLPAFPTSFAQARDNFTDRIRLGLDLKGGTHLILQVQTQEAIKQFTDQTLDRLRKELNDSGIHVQDIKELDDQDIGVINVTPEQSARFQDLIRSSYQDWELAPMPGQNSYKMSLRNTSIGVIRADTLRLSVETIRHRIDLLGLTEPVVSEYARGQDEILVQLPGEGDPTRAKSIIQAGGQLELRLVVGARSYSSMAEAYAAQPNGILPPNTELLPGREEGGPGQPAHAADVYYLVDRYAPVTGRDLRSAKAVPSSDNPGAYEVSFTLSNAAAKRFGEFTEANLQRQMAIVLDRRVYTAPVIQSRIEDQGRITGRFGLDEANDLALVLRSGSLPASIKYLEERTIGPSLGADSIREGVRASVVSLAVVMVFMLVYYRLSGLNAVLALLLNLVILLAALAYFQAVLTLPGIAGVILTIGMGVDSNVLIFERIREELRNGKPNPSAVEVGFNRAFLTIIDTHVTTVVSAAFLFIFGTGPVRGFAVTLVIGLIANIFTAVYVSRTIFAWHLGRMSREAALSI
ncbi:MAG TPA: protein translocase subunit SecD [Candidatus Acidoferrales bacterium]|nr:protein translocase subunit SecD [Candidatus Acidoferrales bacterium]